jgi:hypothetical protein
MVVHAGAQAALTFVLQRVGGERHDGQGAEALPAANQARCAMAVEHRHLDVHQDQIKSGRTFRSQQSHRLVTVTGNLRVDPDRLQHSGDDLDVQRVIVDQQHAGAAVVRG